VRENVGSYEVVRVLARGGMAVVYLARQPTLDRDVALKRLHLESSDPTLAERFVREARLAAGLDHPNVVTLYDFFEHAGVPYIAMEYVGGGSLRRLVGKLGLPQVFGVLEGILAGLGHAEVRGIVHRDLKPENVLISRNGGVKIADFGIARAYNALTPSLTGTGTAIGTPTYMAPEQVTGEPLGPHTDFYALGVMAYEMLAGQPPFDPQVAPVAVLYCHVHKPPPPLATLAPNAPPPLCTWIEWLLAKAPADRPASAVAARQALEEIAVDELGPYWRRTAAITPESTPVPTLEVAAEEPPTRRSTPTTQVPARARRRRRAVGAATAVAVAGAATAAALVLPAAGPPPARPSQPGAAARKVADAVPYDFNGDRRHDVVLGMPSSGPSGAGVVVVVRPGSSRVITPKDAHVNGPYTGDEGFGRGVASADFDHDGHADLAISVPGRDRIAVISGTAHGLAGTVKTIRASQFRFDPGSGRYGHRIVAADMNRDGYDDIVIGAPAGDPGPSGSTGIIQVFYGGRDGLGADRRSIPRPSESVTRFGTAVRVGDINADGNVDVVEGAPDAPLAGGGHGSYCLGTRSGEFQTCRVLIGATSLGTSALAVANVNGDRYKDIVQGDHVVEAAAVGRAAAGGEVRLWLGSKHGVRSRPLVVDQDTAWMPGDDETGDAFGASVGAADLDRDGYADIAVSAPGENAGDGAVTIIRGGRAGFAREAHTAFRVGEGLPGEPGGAAQVGQLSVMDVKGDKRPDVLVTAGGAHDLPHALYVMVPRKGAFAPGEIRIWRPLRRPIGVPGAQINDIRIGREAGA
jgi:predicted Ser/Thr protein kinase